MRDLIVKNLKVKNKKNNLKIGDDVRILYKKGVYDKGYYPLWTDTTHKIKNIKKDILNNKLRFELEGDIRKRFYPAELQKVIDPEYRIESVLKYRTRKGKREALVKWLNYPSSENSWISVNQLKNLQS